MRRNRLLLPWGLLAGLLIATAAVEGLNIKPPSLRTKSRSSPTTTRATTSTTTTTTTTTTTEAPETTTEIAHENDTVVDVTPKSNLSGIPQLDYVYDPNLPRELPKGYNLSEYPFFERVPEAVQYDCEGKLDGFYANTEFKCQIYHHCVSGLRYDFLCANYTAFDQRTFICQFVSEVDCVNSEKWWFRNEPLYKGRTTTTTTTTTTTAAPTTSTRRPAGGRRRRPFRRRRPQYDYYDDEEYDDDEYEDDLEGPGQTGDRQRKRQRRPITASVAKPDAEADEKPLKPIGASVYRPRVPPKIRRPVPLNEREKYNYKSKDGATGAVSAEKSPTVPAVAEPEKPKRPVESPAPVDKPRPQKSRPQDDDDQYYDYEDYDQPTRTTSRKNHQDYYAPSGGDRDFTRRPAMSGAGRPVRRNHPDRRRPAIQEYDDDYEDDQRSYRPSAPAQNSRRRPNKSRKRPYQRDDYYDDDEYERPSHRDTKRPQGSRDAYDRPSAPARGSVYDRPAPSRDSAQRTPTRDTAAYDRAAPSSRDSTYDRPAKPNRDSSYERPATLSRDTTYERPSTPPRDSAYERPATSSRDSANVRPATPSRESAYERKPPPTRDATYERPAANRDGTSRDSGYEREAPTSRDTDFERDDLELSRATSKDSDRVTVSKKRTQGTTRDSTYERPRQERPSARGSPDYDSQATSRPLPSRQRPAEPESSKPIPATRAAYITPYRKRGSEEPAAVSGLRGVPRPAPKVTTPPPLPDSEYYDDDEELELEDELPERPTGSGRTQTGSYQEGDAERARPPAQRATPTGHARLTPAADDIRTRTRMSFDDEDDSDAGAVSGAKTSPSREQTRSNTNRAAESILEQPPVRAAQGTLRAKEEADEEENQQHEAFRPAEVTTNRYSNFRRKGAQGGGNEAKNAPPPREDRVVEVAEDVHIAPSSQGRGQATGNDNLRQLDVELESDTSHEDSSRHLDTSKFISSAEANDKKPVPQSQGYLNRSPQTIVDEDPVPTGRGANKSPEFQDDHRNELPDINDPEYDVTLNEALQPTRPILLSTEGAVDKRSKVQYRDVSAEPLPSASQTHVSKAPPPASTAQYDDYEDAPIPTGRGGTTESVFRASPALLPSGTLRQLETELSHAPPRQRVSPPPYRSGTIREAEFYRAAVDPLALRLGFDVNYDQAAKYRPRRKLVWRDRFHDFYNLY